MLSQSQLSIFVFIIIYHWFILNITLKNVYQFWISKDKRPSSKDTDKSMWALGMPSGHVETTTIICLTLVYYYNLPLKMALLVIFTMALQRIATKKHSVEQTVAGFLLGCLYGLIYIKTNYSLASVGIMLLINVIYIALLEAKITEKMKKIPDWVDPVLLPIIKKKQNISYVDKLLEIYTKISIEKMSGRNILYYEWSFLEEGMDMFISKFDWNTIDVIVGIKTGGAIISNYISKKVDKLCYYVKPQHKKYKCNKTDANFISKVITRGVYTNVSDYELCEILEENVEGKRILLIDDLICSGKTIKYTKNYLYKNKNALEVFPLIYEKNTSYPYISKDMPLLMPWGYES